MATATEAPAVEEPAAQPIDSASEPASGTVAPDAKPTSKLQLVGLVVGIVVVAAALFGGGVLVGMNINGGTGTSQQGQFGPGNGGFRQNGGGFGRQNGQNGGGFGQQGTQNGGTQGGFGQQGGPMNQNGTQQGSSNS